MRTSPGSLARALRSRSGLTLGVVAAAALAACGSSHPSDRGGSASGGSTSSGAATGGAGDTGGTGGYVSAGQCPTCPVLPLEVLGPANTTVDVTLSLTDPASATRISLLIHSLDSEQKASVAINSGAFVAITNTTATVLGQGKAFGGIGGGYGTLSLTMPVPAGALTAGANTLHFRFNGTDGRSLGYRVLALNFLDASGTALLPDSAFVADDPAAWTPPLPGAADLAAGEVAWRTATLTTSPLDSTPLLAHCTDCHAQDGRDLKYFNFSNLSITQRSQFHGLSDQQGDQIASFIRSLGSPSPGRPWNPPYQPGPALASAPLSAWSAGAGLDAVVDPESGAQATLPGSGATDPAALFDGTEFTPVPRQFVPIPLLLIDWNHWLPAVHPLDSMKKRGLDFTTTNNDKDYLALRHSLLGQNGMTGPAYAAAFAYGSQTLENDLATWGDSMTYDLYGQLFPANPDVAASWTTEDMVEVYSSGKWNAVKQWELMQEFSLEGQGPGLYGINGAPRGWFSNRHVFDASPAIIGRLTNDVAQNAVSAEGAGDPVVRNQYLSNVWYQLQLLLNDGTRHRTRGGHHTIDWGYADGHFGDLENAVHGGQPMRVTIFQLDAMREHDSSIGPEDTWWGWNLRDEVPTNMHLEFPEWATEPHAASIVQAIFQIWLEKSATFEQAQWKLNQDVEVPGDTTWPQDHTGSMGYDGLNVGTEGWILGDATQGDLNRSIADQFWKSLTQMQTLGVAPAVVTATADFGKFMWPAPANGWDTYRAPTATETAVPAGVTAKAGVESVTVSWTAAPGATSYNVKRARSGDAAPLAVALLAAGTSYVDHRRTPGQAYSYTVSANFADGEGPASAAVSATPTTGLVARFSFDEASGPVTDASTGGNPAGALTGGATRQAGGSGQVLALDGTGYVSFPMSLHRWLGATSTVSFWIKTTAVGQSNLWETPGVIGSPYDPKEAHSMTELGILDPAGHIGAVFTDTDHTGVFSAAPVNDGQWHAVVISRDATSGAVVVYVDGKLSTSGTSGTGVLAERVYSLGRLDNTTRGLLVGSLDEVAIYDTVLAAGDVAALFSKGH